MSKEEIKIKIDYYKSAINRANCKTEKRNLRLLMKKI